MAAADATAAAEQKAASEARRVLDDLAVMAAGYGGNAIVASMAMARVEGKIFKKGFARAEMSDNEISRRGLVLGGLALMLSGCTQATGAMSLAFPERPLPDPRFQRQRVQYDGGESPGTIVVDIADRFLYAVEEDGWATRYGVAVGEQGLTFTGRATVGRKADWPSWQPTAA